MIGTDAGAPLICRGSAYLQGLRLTDPVRSLAENNPGRGCHHHEQDQGDPEYSEQGKHDASPPYRETFSGKPFPGNTAGSSAPIGIPKLGPMPLRAIVGMAPPVHKTFRRAATGRRGPVG